MAPEPGDLVFTKKKPSSFHGTPLLPYLIDRAIDTLIVTGGATCNCVRATVFDAFSYNYRTIVPADAVFDRLPISHEINLFDMNRCSADVTDTEAVLAYFADLASARGLNAADGTCYSGCGRSAADGFLANPVRSGRKQP